MFQDFLYNPNSATSGGMFGLKNGHPHLILTKGADKIAIDGLGIYIR
jgi:hypothetical protein